MKQEQETRQLSLGMPSKKTTKVLLSILLLLLVAAGSLYFYDLRNLKQKGFEYWKTQDFRTGQSFVENTLKDKKSYSIDVPLNKAAYARVTVSFITNENYHGTGKPSILAETIYLKRNYIGDFQVNDSKTIFIENYSWNDYLVLARKYDFSDVNPDPKNINILGNRDKPVEQRLTKEQIERSNIIPIIYARLRGSDYAILSMDQGKCNTEENFDLTPNLPLQEYIKAVDACKLNFQKIWDKAVAEYENGARE